MPMYPSQRPGPGSSVRTDGTTDLPQCPTHSVVDVLFVCLVHGDVLQSKGVGLGGLASAWEAKWHVMGEGRACIVVVFKGRQVVVHAVLLAEHGEGLLLGDQVVHQFGQGVGELLMGKERSLLVPLLRWVGRKLTLEKELVTLLSSPPSPVGVTCSASAMTVSRAALIPARS